MLSKNGSDNTIGSRRNTIIGIDIGVYEWVEEARPLFETTNKMYELMDS